MGYMLTPITISVHQEKENPIYGETATHVHLTDEAGGFFIKLQQNNDANELGAVRLEFEELQYIMQAVEMLKSTMPKGNE